MWRLGIPKWKQKRKSVFGGQVKSREEIEKLTDHIEKHEDKELKAFEEKFDDLWEDAKKID